MVPVLLCIALLVLSSAAVLRIVVDREDEPTGAPPAAPTPPLPEPTPQPRASAPVQAAPSARVVAPPLKRHRIRSSALLMVLVVVIGVVMAAMIGAVVLLAALALRSAVTS